MSRAALGLLFSLLLSLPVAAQEWVPRRVAELQALDKVTARVGVVRAAVGEPARYGTLTILVRSCQARPADEVPDAAAWMEVSDSRSPSGAGPVFRGWMFAENPALSMLEHPVYDLRILSCR